MPAVSLFAELSILQQFNTYIDYRYPAPSALRAAPPDGEPRGFGAFRHLTNVLLPPSGEVPKAIGAC